MQGGEVMLDIIAFALISFAVGVGVGHWAGYAKALKRVAGARALGYLSGMTDTLEAARRAKRDGRPE